MASLNLVQLTGHLGRDVDLKYSQSGNSVANLSVATDESYTDRGANKVTRTEWHRMVAYGRTAENCASFLTKGSLVYVEGSLQTRKWTDQSGPDRSTTENQGAVRPIHRPQGREGQSPHAHPAASPSAAAVVRP